jgi:hypothetical protein
VAVAGLAAIVAIPSLWNRFVYDDVQVIVENRLVQSLASAPDIWTSSYWPVGGLYRPLTIQLFNLEWALGGGNPVVFRVGSLLLAALVTFLVWRLAGRILEPLPAAIAASLFAVHPVHVETVANTVGQSELLAALFTLLAVERYLAWRVQGRLDAGRRLALAGLTLLAIFSKETGYVAPLLMGAAELTIFRAPRRIALPVFGLQAGAVSAALLIRLTVLGSLSGETPSAALQGLGILARARGMLAIVPEWARLSFWPAHLQGEYGPPALSVANAPAGKTLGGAVLLIGALALVGWGWRRRKTVALGVIWIAVAIFPVSNLLAPTGIILAERTLFLPSVGAVLLVAALGSALAPRVPRAVRLAMGTGAVALVLVGALWSSRRALVWRSQSIFFAGLVEDAPRTYRAHYVASRFHYGERRFGEAERAARHALELYQADHKVYDQLGQVLRAMDRCAEAVPILAEGVRVAPRETTIRSRLIECRLAVGDTAGARSAALEGVEAGQSEFAGTLRRLGAPVTR